MNIFITGGTGYLGSALISHLTNKKDDSRLVTLARDYNRAQKLALKIENNWKLEYEYGDILYQDYNFKNIDAVIHLASEHYHYK